MATGPPRPPGPPGPPGRPGTPSRGPAPRPGASRSPAPGARRVARKADRIRYSAAKIEETHWGRKVLGFVVVVALVLGAIGWYRYLTRPQIVVPLTRAAAPTEMPAPAAKAAPASSEPPAPGVTTASAAASASEPVTISAQSLMEELRADPTVTPAQAFDQHYKNREVTWSGTMTTIAPPVDRLRHFEFKDADGTHIVAWCFTDAELAPGASVTVRGRLASRLNDGFVVDRCQVLQ